MTREHKLALIVGFSLVLLVGVLIADHLSLARRAQIAPVGEQELTVARGHIQLPPDPLLLPPPPVTPLPQEAAALPREVPQLVPTPTPEQELAAGAGQDGSASDRLVMGPPRPSPLEPTPAPSPVQDLEKQIAEAGGGIQGGVIHLPPVVEVSKTKPDVTEARKVAKPKTLAVGPEQPAPAPVKTYTVKKGDTLIKIAQKQYGDGQLWRELATYNGSKDGTVFLGASIKLPAKEALTGKSAGKPRELASPSPAKAAPKKADPAPAKPSRTELAMTYTVKKGDTLGDISRTVLGTSRRWREIAELNKIDDVDVVTAGTVLKVPAMRG